MLTLIEALNYRCLRDVRCPLRPFQALVGPNGSGKSTFLDVVAFLGTLIKRDEGGLEPCISSRSDSSSFADLIWHEEKSSFELAVEARIEETAKAQPTIDRGYTHVRYEVAIGVDELGVDPVIEFESLTLFIEDAPGIIDQRVLFPEHKIQRETLRMKYGPRVRGSREQRTIFRRMGDKRVNYYPENYERPGKGFGTAWSFKSTDSALGNLPAGEVEFPTTVWFRSLLQSGSKTVVLDSAALRHMSPPVISGSRKYEYESNGKNLPRVIRQIANESPQLFSRWIAHVREALPFVEEIQVQERQDIKHAYLVVKYSNGASVPSWGISDGTLRFLALSLLAYLPAPAGIYLIEEPEIGIHPPILAHLGDSLRSVFKSQVLVATHSPVLISQLDLADILCFAQTRDGATDIVRGDEHPRLRDWQKSVPLGDLLAAGVFGG